MSEFIQFVVLGFGLGACYALIAEGVVLVYRGSGVINFAQGAFAFLGAAAYYEAHHKLGTVGALIIAIAVGAGAGALTQALVMRQLRGTAPIVRVIATLGVLIIIQSIGSLRYSATVEGVSQYLPAHAWHVGGVLIESDRVFLAAIAGLITIGLIIMQRHTLIGLATLAASENDVAASALGWSPASLALFNWTLAGALAGLAGALIVPLTGLLTNVVSLLIVAALAAAVLGGFESFGRTFIGAMGIGIAQSLVTRYFNHTGAFDAVPFVVVIVVMILTGRNLPLRSHVLDRMPRLGSGTVRPIPFAAAFIGFMLLVGFVFNQSWLDAWTVSLAFGVVMLSVVIVTGFAGQISLAQFTMAGLGAYVAGRLMSGAHWQFWTAALAAMAASIPIGAVFAIPALRTRGVNLAVVTLGLSVTVSATLFNNLSATGGPIGTTVSPRLFGADIDGLLHSVRYLFFVAVLFFLACLIVTNLRRSGAGRRLIAIRENERAAASMGISVMGTKLYAFSLASVIAALGGILITFRQPTIIYPQFDPFGSLNVVAFCVIGGVGYISGPFWGSLIFAGGVFSLLNGLVSGIDKYIGLIGGIGLVITLIANPDGIAQGLQNQIAWMRQRLGSRSKRTGRARRALARVTAPLAPTHAKAIAGISADETGQVEPRTLTVKGVGVRFGGVQAVQDFDLTVAPGEVVGLIGPNGAGKTTLIDAISGFVTPWSGTITLDEDDLLKRSASSRVRHGVARSWQSLELLDDLTVVENIGIAAEATSWRWWNNVRMLFLPGRLQLTRSARAAIVEFQLTDDLLRTPSDLSYGRRRLVGIARAIASSPSVLMLDEPAAGLSTSESRELGHLIRRLADVWGMGVLLVEHDVDLVMSVCDRVSVLNFGERLADGLPADIAVDPAVIAAYLGDETDLADDPHPVAPTAGQR